MTKLQRRIKYNTRYSIIMYVEPSWAVPNKDCKRIVFYPTYYRHTIDILLKSTLQEGIVERKKALKRLLC